MRLLFIHQNFPGQYKHLAPAFGRDARMEVKAIGKRTARGVDGVELLRYEVTRKAHPQTHHYLRRLENAVLHGQAVARQLLNLKKSGFVPDIICGHPGWGETLFAKDVFPDVPLLHYCEFYYHAFGADANFDPSDTPTLDEICRTRLHNAQHLLSLECCDRGVSPTQWQRQQFPEPLRDKIAVIHDGIDTDAARPDANASFRLPNGKILRAGDEVVTYVSRNFEPHRGFPTVMRAVAEICRRRPNTQIIMVGGDDVSYGVKLPAGETWRERMLAEVEIDPNRVHFLGRVPYDQFIRILQVSAAHIYLTVPFVLSWSMLEAMAAGCLVIASDTPPVREVIEDGRNGLLVDFFSAGDLADAVDRALDDPTGVERLRRQARLTVQDRYSLARCLPLQQKLVLDTATGGAGTHKTAAA